jgi:hypothetical protein
MYSFKLKGNKCLFKNGSFYVRKEIDSYSYILNIESLINLIP